MLLVCREEFANELRELIRAFENAGASEKLDDCRAEIDCVYENGELTARVEYYRAYKDEKPSGKTEYNGVNINGGLAEKTECGNVQKSGEAAETEYEKTTLILREAACVGAIEVKRKTKRMLKRIFYDALSKLTGENLPYGSLTGIRPTKLAYEILENGGGYEYAEREISEKPSYEILKKNQDGGGYKYAERVLAEYFRVSEIKARLITEIIKNQAGIYEKNPTLYDVYVNIPFCPSRCSYCTFLTADIKRAAGLIEPYTEYLLRELDLAFEISGGACNALYIGGGTPTAVDCKTLEKILKKAAKFSFREFTVEAGRPDTVTAENLALIKDYGAARISVNPQSFNERTLGIIGRSHGEKHIYDAFALAERFGFSINADIIAMLPGESVDDFLYTVNRAAALGPQNITVHNLALKRGSGLVSSNFKHGAAADAGGDNCGGFAGRVGGTARTVSTVQTQAELMTDGAYSLLKDAGYSPYYMYRQKYMSGNLENCGYAKPGFACAYNIDVMEETHCVMAVGAGAISKRVTSGGKIDRQANIKDVKGYMQCFSELYAKKRRFFSD
ncbi:MAG: coproporphyrinogen dehydrogenase HemZ [Clostridiales bacterium]|jgi:oxygen-independent coproporphyrinogen-3 oxidase|nr:coproporphyrinogen dehydrogenase HemZ [Clostridiales bacterium]